LSAPRDLTDLPAEGDLCLALPLGTRAAVRVEGQPIPGSDPWAIREVDGLPYYLHKDATNGTFVLELAPEAVGTFEVPVAEGQTVIVEVGAEVPLGTLGCGFYTGSSRNTYPETEEACLRHQVAYGMTTCTPGPAWPGLEPSSEAFAQSMNAAVRAGMTGPFFTQSLPPKWGVQAQALAETEWPEWYIPPRDEPMPCDEAEVREKAQPIIDAGVKTCACTGAESMLIYGDVIDWWLVRPEGLTRTLQEKARQEGKLLWVYLSQIRGTNAPLHRYLTGLWAWATGIEGVLLWTYMHSIASFRDAAGGWHNQSASDHALATPSGPLPTVGLVGMYQGLVDHAVLTELERRVRDEAMHSPREAEFVSVWLQQVRECVQWCFWPGRRPDSKAFDRSDIMLPEVPSMGEVRRRCLQHLTSWGDYAPGPQIGRKRVGQGACG